MPNPASTLSKDKHPTAEQLFEEVAWMGQRLLEARETIGTAPLVVTYYDTNGNERQKTNPVYDAYNALLSSYLKAGRALEEMLADPQAGGEPVDFSLDSIVLTVNPLKAAGQ